MTCRYVSEYLCLKTLVTHSYENISESTEKSVIAGKSHISLILPHLSVEYIIVLSEVCIKNIIYGLYFWFYIK